MAVCWIPSDMYDKASNSLRKVGKKTYLQVSSDNIPHIGVRNIIRRGRNLRKENQLGKRLVNEEEIKNVNIRNNLPRVQGMELDGNWHAIMEIANTRTPETGDIENWKFEVEVDRTYQDGKGAEEFYDRQWWPHNLKTLYDRATKDGWYSKVRGRCKEWRTPAYKSHHNHVTQSQRTSHFSNHSASGLP
ncbi:hypothetical protein BYT27DRAFT_7209528 [Phlegmacium glaucopus]|nr:hypothetical protein BYT27DRAFT_7209528 [Phlegmacium glaucopus]